MCLQAMAHFAVRPACRRGMMCMSVSWVNDLMKSER